MINVDLIDLHGNTIDSCVAPNDERICESVRNLALNARYSFLSPEFWTWDSDGAGNIVIDFGHHACHARFRDFDATAVTKDRETVLEEKKAVKCA